MRRRPYIVGLIFLVFFIMSFLTNILGPIVPDIIKSFRVSLGAAAFLPFSFFVVFAVFVVQCFCFYSPSLNSGVGSGKSRITHA